VNNNPLKQLQALGQSIWLDYIRRDLIADGELHRLIEEDGLRGMTSNPAIFEQAIVESHAYDDDIRAMAGRETKAIYEALTQDDVRSAADTFWPLYEATDGNDGYVSLEVNPHLAHDAEGTIQEARELWRSLDRPNVMIKVPATAEGLPAIEHLIGEGINVNVTLIFGIPRYRQVAEAYIDGIGAWLGHGGDARRVASVASFFVSRIDALVDPLLDAIVARGGQAAGLAKAMRGKVAVASAKLAYQSYEDLFGSIHFCGLAQSGACVQRLLWASTGVKNPDFSDVKYIEGLIGPDTVTTVPPATLAAYRDHGKPRARLEEDAMEAHWLLEQLGEVGVDLDRATQQLEDEGVEKFSKPFDQLLETLAQRSSQPGSAL
jgi:transaldolase